VPLSPSAQNELRAELGAIEAFRKQINAKLDARARVIQQVLEPFDVGQTKLPFGANGGGVTDSAEQLRDRLRTATALKITITNKFASTGLRAAILDVLKTSGPGRAPKIAAILEHAGFKNDSKTPLATRVYNDLWRMIEPGIVENKDGVFRLKETA